MGVRSKLVWKLGAAVVAIMTVAIALSGYVSNHICAHYSLESARAFLRFNTESVVKGIGRLMMSRDNSGIEQLLVEVSRDSNVYGEIRLLSHPAGEVAVSRFGSAGGTLAVHDHVCAVCHARDNHAEGIPVTVDKIIHGRDGSRVLSVMAPIINEPGCRNAACHAHTSSPPILGFLNADYSLHPIDANVSDRVALIVLTVLASLLLGVVALRFMFTRLLARPINGLIQGTKHITAGQLDFRFDQNRHDEIGVLEKSFNVMTARIQAHWEELRSVTDYLGGILENSADIIVTATPEGCIETFNRGAEEALGYSRAEVIGQRAEILFADPRDRDHAIARLEDDAGVKNHETRFVTKNGQVRNVLLTLSYLRDREGNPIGTFGISKDITQEKALHQELVHSQKLAAIGQVVTGIQHGIKNLLNSLKGGAYLIRSGIGKDDMRQIEEGSAMLEEGVERIGALAHHMLDYAKEWKVDLQRIDLTELLRKIGDLNRPVATEQEVALRCDLVDGLPAILCDPKLIHMAATDIVVNALDACAWKEYRSGECPVVALKDYLSENGDFVVIEVRDNGCGMSDEVKRNVFTPFFSTKKARGIGLGLALTARIIKMHGGEIGVESEPDRGATFRVHLPINGPDPEQK